MHLALSRDYPSFGGFVRPVGATSRGEADVSGRGGARVMRPRSAARDVLGIAAVLIGLVAAVAFALPGPASGAPKPSPTPAAEANAISGGLPISLNLLGIHLTVTIPLDLGAILHPSSSSSSSSTPPPTSSHTSSHPTSPHSSHPTSQQSTTQTQPNFFQPPPTSTSSTTTSHSTSTSSSAPPTNTPKGKTVLGLAGTVLSNLLPTSLTRGLYLATFLLGVGIVVAVIRMGRRNGRHTA